MLSRTATTLVSISIRFVGNGLPSYCRLSRLVCSQQDSAQLGGNRVAVDILRNLGSLGCAWYLLALLQPTSENRAFFYDGLVSDAVRRVEC